MDKTKIILDGMEQRIPLINLNISSELNNENVLIKKFDRVH